MRKKNKKPLICSPVENTKTGIWIESILAVIDIIENEWVLDKQPIVFWEKIVVLEILLGETSEEFVLVLVGLVEEFN